MSELLGGGVTYDYVVEHGTHMLGLLLDTRGLIASWDMEYKGACTSCWMVEAAVYFTFFVSDHGGYRAIGRSDLFCA